MKGLKIKKLHYILVLFLISASYLFSQNNFADMENNITQAGDDTFEVKKCERLAQYIISFRGGIGSIHGVYNTPVSVMLDIPIDYNVSITSNYFTSGKNSVTFSWLGLGLGHTFKRTDNFISKLNMYFMYGEEKAPYPDFYYKDKYGFGAGLIWDILLGIKPVYISISPELIGLYPIIDYVGISFGLNFVY